jgi:hypothetical protein
MLPAGKDLLDELEKRRFLFIGYVVFAEQDDSMVYVLV